MPFEFKDPGELVDDDLALMLIRTRPADPEKDNVADYRFEMRHRASGQKAGNIDLRTSLTPRLAQFGGHIGYEVDEQFRCNAYAARACRLLVPLARSHGIDPILITCDPDNIPSRRTCEKIGARLIDIHDAMTDAGSMRPTCYFHL